MGELKLRRCGKCKGLLGNEDTMVCPHCGADLISVGVEIFRTRRCPECGALLHHGGAACRKCGTRFEEQEKGWNLA